MYVATSLALTLHWHGLWVMNGAAQGSPGQAEHEMGQGMGEGPMYCRSVPSPVVTDKVAMRGPVVPR